MPMLTDHALTKSRFLAGTQCLKRVWWEVHEPDAPELVPSTGARFLMDQGRRVGAYAQRYVPGGVVVQRGGRSLEAILSDSVRAIESAAPAVYEAGFIAHDTLVYADILERVAGGWVLIEVKSTLRVDDKHIPDLALQAWVLRAAGVPVVRCEVMHLNRECTYPDLSRLFVRADVTDRVELLLPTIGQRVAEMIAALASDRPSREVGDHCHAPGDCPFLGRCWPDLPPHHLSTLYAVRKQRLVEWTAAGWSTIGDLPESVKLSVVAARQRRAVRTGAIVVEREALMAALGTLRRPVAHLDFETIMPAIPVWPGCHPYETVPVQLSCHCVAADGTTRHVEWIASGCDDPRPAVARAIVDACAGAETVTAYNASFERGCIEALADACPECAGDLRAIAARLVDLLPIVRNHVYHPDFRGSFSLKRVLPALVPELGYDGLAIAEGETASAELMRLMFDADDIEPTEREQVRAALLAYCRRDTEAMVALTERLAQLAM